MLRRGLLAGVLLLSAACTAGPERTDPPDGLSAELMQYRGERLTRDVAVAFSNETGQRVDLRTMTLTSNRWKDAVRWDGDKQITDGFGTGIDVSPPQGSCPEGEDLSVTADLTYRLGGDERRSRLAVSDPYGVLRDLVDGDCGQQAFAAATTMTVGERRVSRDRWSAVLILTPTGEGDDVVLLGLAPTLRFAFGPRTPTEVELPLATEQRVDLDVVMGRCDPHVVAEDKVGSRFGVWVRTADLENAYFTLPLDDEIRASLEDFYAQRCQP